ncbi:hemerythrin domain-containing protein [Thermodesulforhabdus norvegica]|uniref:Hemerythrin-like domain-containing protein n=1 Tax=Thermodesulforhabdus norvegica TaxID=39841 RepID=A0A1I4S3N2_9BACT|nr:hemerythrin domain-containing protein [Thermodesulforhabdus norvegica]SFM58853.1 Hemerythrin-like domain-containing protein [Thermodesulforhabdus norvegica]
MSRRMYRVGGIAMFSREKQKALDILEREHQVILGMLSVLDRICSTGRPIDDEFLEDMEKIIAFFKEFADRCHHGKEGALLFPALEVHGTEEVKLAVKELSDQHVKGRKLVAQMKNALEEMKKGNQAALEGFCKSAKEYGDFLRGHIAAEDEDLFLTARSLLPDLEQDRLVREFERVEHEEIGQGVHERLHRVAHEMSEKYRD